MRRLWVLRVLVLILLIVVAAKPVMVRPDPGVPSNWAILLDTSKSMRVKDPIRRLDLATKKIRPLLDRFKKNRVFEFSNELNELEKKELSELTLKGQKTNLASAIRDVFKEKEYRGAIIVTDGRQVGAGDPVSEAASAGFPLMLVGVGDSNYFRDVSVKEIQNPPFAFKNVPISFAAVVSVVGYPNEKITVRLKEGGRVLSFQTIQVRGDKGETVVNFNWTPTTLGSKNLSIEVGQYKGEVTTLNNRKNFTLDVGRDRFRVLYICGRPGPEYGFLRHQFKSDPAVELVTFVILRNASNVVAVPDGELSLIPFPTQNVLINQMATFDLVVFEEFSYQNYGLLPTILTAIRKKVEDGGSFLLMGDADIFGPTSRYNLPGIKEMFPVEMGLNEVRNVTGFHKFISKAPSHPILKLEGNPQRNRELWVALPDIDGFTFLPKVKPGAQVLGSVRYQGKEAPILTVWKFGKGRVGVLATRTTWRWSMLDGKKGNYSYAYQQFWKNVVLWLTHSDEFKSVRVAMEEKYLSRGESKPIRVWVYDEYFTPISDADVRLQIIRPDGQQENLRTHQETTGVFLAPFEGKQIGRHKVQAWVFRKGKKFGQDKMNFRVVEGHFEEEDLRPDFQSLKEMAHATGGKFLTADEFSLPVFEEFNKQIQETFGQKVLIWNSPWFLGLCVLFLIIEWFLRKRRGLP